MHREQLWLVIDNQMAKNKESDMDSGVGRWLMGISSSKNLGSPSGLP